jgi:hypothetical protein
MNIAITRYHGELLPADATMKNMINRPGLNETVAIISGLYCEYLLFSRGKFEILYQSLVFSTPIHIYSATLSCSSGLNLSFFRKQLYIN